LRGAPAEEIHCKICSKPVDLALDLATDEHGQAVHSDCYANHLKKSSDADAVRLLTEKWQAF
jgi:hypothetical protein